MGIRDILAKVGKRMAERRSKTFIRLQKKFTTPEGERLPIKLYRTRFAEKHGRNLKYLGKRLEKGMGLRKREKGESETKIKFPKSKRAKVIIKYVGGRPQQYAQPQNQTQRAINILDVEDSFFR